MTNSLKIALLISLAVHGAFLAPYTAIRPDKQLDITTDIDFNYVIIHRPVLAIDEEKPQESVREKSGEGQETDIAASVSKKKIVDDLSEQQVSEKTAGDTREEKIKILDVDQTAFLEYYNLVREKIRSEIVKRNNVIKSGEVTVVFTVSPKGELIRIENIKSEKYILSDNISRGVKNAAPFPVFPGEFNKKPITFSLTIKVV
jgi:outer membrane biosynthesis protein TonB